MRRKVVSLLLVATIVMGTMVGCSTSQQKNAGKDVQTEGNTEAGDVDPSLVNTELSGEIT